MSKKNVFVIGLDEFNQKKLERLPLASDVRFLPALTVQDIRGVSSYSMQDLLDRAIAAIEQEDRVDAICTYWDFPGTTMLPILCERFGVPGPSLESVMKCENKFWSRLEQQKVIPEHIPQFRAVDPFDEEAFEKVDLIPPFWVKPIKSFRSFLSYRVNGRQVFDAAMEEAKKHVDYMGEPFHYIMEKFGMPVELAEMKETMIAESPLSGAMCTLEGYVYQGSVVGYGVVDSVRDADRSSFSRYEYPSSLPLEVTHRMIDVARRALGQIGYDNACFNIEFFYDSTSDNVYLLEINPRCSQAHTDIFEKVHGVSHLNVMLSLALGQRPRPMERKGRHNLAAHFMMRVFENGRVFTTPGPQDLDRLKTEIPDIEVKVAVRPGMRLSELRGQDSYSFEVGNVFIGARDQAELLERYGKALRLLPFEIAPDLPNLQVY